MSLATLLAKYNWKEIYDENYFIEEPKEWTPYSADRPICMLPVTCSNGLHYDRPREAAIFYGLKTEQITQAIENNKDINGVTFKLKTY